MARVISFTSREFDASERYAGVALGMKKISPVKMGATGLIVVVILRRMLLAPSQSG